MSELSKYIQKPTFIKIKLLDGRSIGIRKWMMAEEKEFLFAIESRKEQKDTEDNNISITIDESIKLARRCVDKPDLINKLSKHNLIYLLSELRKASKGSTINFNFNCTNERWPDYIKLSPEQAEREGVVGRSRTLFDDVIDLNSDEDVTIKRFDKATVTVKNFKFYVNEIPYIEQMEIDRFLKELRLSEWNYEYVLASIKAVEPEGQKKIMNFKKEELIEFIDTQLDSTEFKVLSDGIAESLSEFKIIKEVTCPLCQNKSTVVYDEIFSLMVF